MDDHFAREILKEIVARRELPKEKVNRDVAGTLKALGLIETHDAKPGRPNHVKGKFVWRPTNAGIAKVEEWKNADTA